MKKALLFVIILVLSPLLHAESLRFSTLNASNGLPQNTIRAITQDQNGFMWFATEDGIARYDGQDIKVYRYDPDIPHAIPDNVAYQFLTEGQDRLWISIQGEAAIIVLDQSTEHFYPIQPLPSQQANTSVGSSVSALYAKNKDELLIGSVNGVFSISTTKLAITKQLVSRDEFKHAGVISALWQDAHKNLWIASKDGKMGYLSPAGKLTMVDSLINNIIGVKSIKGMGDVVIAGDNGLFQLDYDNQQLRPLFNDTFLKNKNIRDIIQAPDGKLWIASKSGLIRYDPEKHIAVLAEKNPDDENSLPTNELTTLYMSDDETLWIGSTDKGIIRTHLKDYGFSSYSTHNLKTIYPIAPDKQQADSFKNNMIWSIFRDSRDTLWIGHSEGLSRQQKGENTYTNLSQIGTDANPIAIDESWMMSIGEAKGYLWFGTWGEGLIRYSPDTHETTRYSEKSSNPATRLSGNVIRWLLFDEKRNSLWVGTHRKGLSQIDFSTGKIHHYLPDSNNEHAFPHERSRALYLDQQNRLWVGSGGGLAVFDDESKHFNRVNTFPANEIVSDVRGIHQSDENTIWSANGYGLDRINIKTLEVEKRFLEKDGLSRSALYGIIPDNTGKLWIPTIKGLSRFDPDNQRFKNFFVDHNLQSNEFNFNALWKEKDGSIILGGTGGITKFDPSQVDDQYESQNPVILSITAINKSLDETKVLGVSKHTIKNAFVLEADQRSVIIDFTTPEYTFQNNIHYQYRLQDNEEPWQHADRRDVPVRYTNLAPGQHRFQVRAVDDSLEDNPILSIEFSIKAHFWEELWFWLICALLFAVMLFYAIKSLLHYRLEKKLSQERRQLYSMVVHDLGPALKRSQEDLSQLMTKQSHDQQTLSGLNTENNYALSFIEQLRSLSTVEGFSENPELEFLLEDIWDESISSMAAEKDRVHISNIPDASIQVFENSVQFILKNLLSNAIKYSNSDTQVNASLEVSNKDLIIAISDHGHGIKDKLKEKVFKPYERGDMYKAEGLGIGLTLVKNIVRQYNGSISITNNQPKGSVVTVLLRDVVVTC